MRRLIGVLVTALFMFPACGGDSSAKPDADDTKLGPNGKAEHWSDSDSPFLFATDLITTLDDLPMNGEANDIPWAGNYWPVYKDSINDPWEGEGTKSPTEKYAEAFGYVAADVMDAVSADHGIDSQSHRKACTVKADCDTGACSKRPGAESGYCIPTWFGICHAWAPVAILLPEPLEPVEHNGVTFKIQDIKALVTLIYNRTVTRFVSLRCNTDSDDVHFDNYGRPTGVDVECRDTNPGTLHLLLTNYLGIRGASFVEDRTWDDEVWNQPLRGYRVTKLESVSALQANELIGVTGAGGTTHNAAGTVAKNEWFHADAVDVTSGDGVSVTMTGSNDADLYARFGSQPTAADYDCRPYAGGSDETCQLTAESDGKLYISVLGYADSSDFSLTTVVGGSVPADYQFNPEATDFRHVTVDVDYISESAADLDGNLADRIDTYTHTDHYEYVLELAKNDDDKLEIIGGEYIGASKKNHPDFLWLPVSHRGDSVAGGKIKRAEVMSIYQRSRQSDNGGGEGGLQMVDESGTVAKNAVEHYGPYAVKAGETISVVLSGEGDADLYVRAGATPTNVSYDCRPYKNGTDEECHVVSTGAPIYVAVMGYAASSSYALHLEYVEGGGTTDPVDPPPAEVTHLNVQDAIADGETKSYTIDLPAGFAAKFETFSSSDIDLYIQINQAPTTDEFLMRGYTSSGNESVSYTPQANATVHVMVHGYEAADSFTLRSSAQ